MYSDYADPKKAIINKSIHKLLQHADGLITLDGGKLRTSSSCVCDKPIIVVEQNLETHNLQQKNILGWLDTNITVINGDIFDWLSKHPVKNYFLNIDTMSTMINRDQLNMIKSSIKSAYGVAITLVPRDRGGRKLNPRIETLDTFMMECGLSIHKIYSYNREGVPI